MTDNNTRTNGNNEQSLLAAIDLGSNSFHLIVARIEHGEIRPIERIGEKVQLAAGIKKGHLTNGAIEVGLACLARFRQVLDTLQPDIIRVVGTNALRAAKNSREFTTPAEKLLGVPVEIISGREEARLIYLGVAHTLADDMQSRLVVDIGGGSTEFVIGERFESRRLESLHMGCVSYAKRFFPEDKISEKRFRKAYEAASLEVLAIRTAYRNMGWQECVGSSGTLVAIDSVLKEMGLGDDGITPQRLSLLCTELFKFKHVDELELPGLKETRRNVFASGLAIACALFDSLGIERMTISLGALREGVVYDMIGRLSHEDVRERTVTALEQRYGVDEQNAGRVELMVGRLFEAVRDGWDLGNDELRLLRWSARLHEVGLAIAHNQYHKHGEYLIRNSDLPGFSLKDQELLAVLVRAHRRKFPEDLFYVLAQHERARMQRMCILLRLAVLFKFVAQLEGDPEFVAQVEENRLRLTFSSGWLSRHPMTMAELVAERQALKNTDYALTINELPPDSTGD